MPREFYLDSVCHWPKQLPGYAQKSGRKLLKMNERVFITVDLNFATETNLDNEISLSMTMKFLSRWIRGFIFYETFYPGERNVLCKAGNNTQSAYIHEPETSRVPLNIWSPSSNLIS